MSRILKECKVELFIFTLGVFMLAISFNADPLLGSLFFWSGMILSFLGWIGFSFKIRALTLYTRIRTLEKLIEDELHARRFVGEEVRGTDEGIGHKNPSEVRRREDT